MIAASLGKIYYMNDIMSIFHKVTTSPRAELTTGNEDVGRLRFTRDYLRMYERFNNFSQNKYNAPVRESSIRFYERVITNPDKNILLDIPDGLKLYSWYVLLFLTRLLKI